MAKNQHLSDAELLALIDGETSENTAHAHLITCMPCRARRAQLAAIGEELKSIYRTVNLPRAENLPSADGQRAQLRRRLLSVPAPTPWWWPRISGRRWRYLAASFVLSITGISLLAWHETTVHAPMHLAEIAPDSHLTPGDTRQVQLTEICAVNEADGDLDPTVSPMVQQAVFQEYGLNSVHPGDFQIDYLINPQLGGTNDLRNLWPEPYSATAWNARAKDALETRMHQMVCNGQIGLTEAQQEIASNWIAAYKKYFHTDRPLS